MLLSLPVPGTNPAPCPSLVPQGSVVSATPCVLLSSMTTETVCERVRQMEGMDQSMMGQYSATIRKVWAAC